MINRYIKWLSFIFVLGIIIFSVYNEFRIRKKGEGKKDCEIERERKISGRVINTFIDYDNRGRFFITLVDQGDTVEYVNYCMPYAEYNISIGDSIYKLQNSFIYKIFKNGDKSNVVVLECDIDCQKR